MKLVKSILIGLLLFLGSTTAYAELQNGMDADIVVGQPDFTSTTGNNGGRSARTINVAQEVYSDGKKLFVADDLNHRVLIWNSIPTSNFAPADVVVGQTDFTTGGSGVSQTKLNSPDGIFSDGVRLFVADEAANRVLIWNSIPTRNGAPADVVVGQVDFTSNSVVPAGPNTLNSPRTMYSDGKRLIIADTNNNRVLIYNTIPTANNAAADIVIGQPNFSSTSSGTTRQKFTEPHGVWFDGRRLYIADTRNNRVFIYNSLPTSNFPVPDLVLGQPDFTTVNSGTTASKFSQPHGVTSDGRRIYIVDHFGNHRVLIYNSIPKQNFAEADIVLGQPNFTTGGTGSKRNQFNFPVKAVSDGKRLFVSDRTNSRVFIFNISNSAIKLGPQFTQGKAVLGKIFEDLDGNGVQGEGEKGLEGIKIASDTGIYAITDEDGKYHFPYIETGQHILKIDESTLPEGSVITTESPRKIVVTEGILTKISFGIKLPVVIPAKAGIRTDSVDSSFRGNDKGSPLLKTTLSQDPVLLKPALSIEAKIQDKDILFTIHTNYHLFIESSEITLYTKDLKPFKTIPLPNPIPYQYILKKEELLPNQETFYFQLSVKDKQGREDRTAPTQHM